MEPSASCLDVGEGSQAAHPWNVVRRSAESSPKLRDDYWLGALPEGAPGDAPDEYLAQSPLGDQDSDATDDEELLFNQSPTHLMEVAGEEMDNQQAVHGAQAHVLALEINDLAERAVHESTARIGAALNPIMSMEHAEERAKDKEKEKIDERMKEPVYIGGVPLVNLDDIEVSDKDLMIDTYESNDNISPNPDEVGVCGGLGSCSQTMDSNVESTS